MEINQEKLVSIIIPVYNVEKYFNECIESVVKQSYRNIEIIIIEDGSSDSSVSICDNWAENDSRITVIHQEHKGVSGARNVGLDRAKGDYICFVDSDDYVTDNYIEDFVRKIEEVGSDIVFCDINTTRLPKPIYSMQSDQVFSADEFRRFLYNPFSREYVEMVVIWNKIYKRRLFDNLRFEENKIHEDEILMNNFFYTVSQMGYLAAKNYFYRYNRDGITGENNAYKTQHINAVEAYEDRIDIAIKHNDREMAEATLKWTFLKIIDFYKNGNEDMKKMAKEKYVDIFSKYSYLLNAKRYIKYRLFMISPVAFCKLFG
ncbi:Glycosyltransferase involved in cell wall bisynthesis [Butyrivibrio sp. ob235]|uniref:glycosyltransferase family 2 protein n=1 Tax=Butyrivibrio sp. ob235 TaxID=1761780 RepID=UPI0008C4D371|nr:glycosyltransferase [Butyrivibrio sp. ob235]SEL73328.1 Glycosyltransferase involved in cell wall bisynthesis [Butyrivibrio sp. ob235]